jgi:spermidine synthase
MRLFGRQRKPATPAVEISEKDGVRYLHLGGPAIQSAMRLRDPYALELEYTRAMMMFLVLRDTPVSICLVGLGGGSLAKYIHQYLPECRLLALEISAEVVAAARGYFMLPEDDPRLSVQVCDGAARIRDASNAADVLLIDGYDAERIVEDLASIEFYRACREALTPEGIAVFNLWGSDRHFDTYLGRIETAFQGRVLRLPAERRGNIMIFGLTAATHELALAPIMARARAWDARLGLGFTRFLDRMRDSNRTDSGKFLLMSNQDA